MKASDRGNAYEQGLWDRDTMPDMRTVFYSCLGYANTPGWALIQREVVNAFGGFEGLRVVELGCGLGKVSLLFSLLGAKATLLDYNEKQLAAARFVHEQFHFIPDMVGANLLHVPERLLGQFDVAMSYGTAEHFWGVDRQRVFDSHAKVLKPGGLAIVWVPNKYGFLFHFGRAARKLLGRSVSPVNETAFTRCELYRRAKGAGLSDVQIRGGEYLRHDFCNFIVDVPRIFGWAQRSSLPDINTAKERLRDCMTRNCARIRRWDDIFSYPLVLIGQCRSGP